MSRGFIYIYKCNGLKDICKIGKTEDIKSRLSQHVRTPYYGFMPYLDFLTGMPIFTSFAVDDVDKVDKQMKSFLSRHQVSSMEIYQINYGEAITYFSALGILSDKDGYTDYANLIKDYQDRETNEEESIRDCESLSNEMLTRKKDFQTVVEEILANNNSEIPGELETCNFLIDELKEYHIKYNSYIRINNKYININKNKKDRVKIMSALKKILENLKAE
jgi:hypothetical protein